MKMILLFFSIISLLNVEVQAACEDVPDMQVYFRADLTECSNYWLCVAGGSYNKTCQENYLFDIYKESCQPPEQVDCKSRPCNHLGHCLRQDNSTTPTASSTTSSTTPSTVPSTATSTAPSSAPTTVPSTATTATTATSPELYTLVNCTALCDGRDTVVANESCSTSYCNCPFTEPIRCEDWYPGQGYQFCHEFGECIPADFCKKREGCRKQFLAPTTTSTTTTTKTTTTTTPVPRSEPCFREDLACSLETDNLIEIRESKSLEECRDFCTTRNCSYFTYYTDKTGELYYGQCYLFSSCENLVEFTGSITGYNYQDCLCSMEVIAEDGDPLKTIKTYAENEYICLLKCRDQPSCTHYMFTEVISLCQLLGNPVTFSSYANGGVRTGPRQCVHQDGQCGLSMLGSLSNILIDTPYDQEIHVRSAMKTCQVQVDLIAIGAGGRSFSPVGSGLAIAGGGSGFVNHTSVPMMVDSTIKIDYVENWTNNTNYYLVMDNNGVLLQTMPGENGRDKGGNGYSGGGYGEWQMGGENGSDGCNETGWSLSIHNT